MTPTRPRSQDGRPTINHDEILYKIYYDASNSGGYAGPKKLYHAVKRAGYNIPLNEVKEWIQSQYAYSIHGPRRVNFPHRKIRQTYPFQTWSADLADLSGISRFNDGVTFLLVCLDNYTKFLWIEPLQTKSKPEMIRAFDKIFARAPRLPDLLQTDMGLEFVSLKTYFANKNIKLYHTTTGVKAAIAERCIRTIEGKIHLYLTSHNTLRYVNKLPEFVHSYLTSPHRTLHGLTPLEATLPQNALYIKRKYVQDKFRYEHGFRGKAPAFKMGDRVRIRNDPTVFNKGYYKQYSEEVYSINLITDTFPRMYGVEGKTRRFYREQLKLYRPPEKTGPVLEDAKYFVEKTRVVNARINRSGLRSAGQKQFLIRSVADPSFSKWIDERTYKKLQNDGKRFLSRPDQQGQ